MNEDRLNALEEKLAFLEDAVQRIDDVVIDQQKRLHVLRSEYDDLKQKYAELTAEKTNDATAAAEKPPHY